MGVAARSRVWGNFGVISGLSADNPHSYCSLSATARRFREDPIVARHRYELYILLAKKITEASDVLNGTLSRMLVFNQ